MEAFFANIFHYPTVFFTVLLGVMLVYWIFAIIGVLGVDLLDFDLDMDSDVDLDGLTGFAGLMVSLGLTGVPITLVFTLMMLIGWVGTFLIVHFFFFWGASSWLNYLVGTGVVIGVLVISILVTAQIIKPLRTVFRKAHTLPPEKVVIGRTCIVRSSRVDEGFGEATVNLEGVSLILKIRGSGDKKLKIGDAVVLLEHNPENNTYWVIPESEFKH